MRAWPVSNASRYSYHWYASQEGQLDQRLAAMRPWLMQVVLSGSALSPLGWGGVAAMEPLDRGELDNVGKRQASTVLNPAMN